MPELSVAQLAEATSGELLRGDPAARVSSFEIDTRRLRDGGAFFALKGSHTDGHRFLAEAQARGARVAVVETPPEDGARSPAALIRVASVIAALAGCGRYVRRSIAGARWIALTGSNGKTTTKELIAAGLGTVAPTHRTAGNFNNHLGVPLTLLACPEEARFVVVELGMSDHGEIAHLAALVDPDVGLVTNVRAAHLEKLGSLDDIAAAKGELFATLRSDATSVVNLDDAHVRVQATRHAGPRVTFGQHASSDLRLEEIESRFVPGASLRFRRGDRSYGAQLRLGGGARGAERARRAGRGRGRVRDRSGGRHRRHAARRGRTGPGARASPAERHPARGRHLQQQPVGAGLGARDAAAHRQPDEESS